MGDPKAVTTAQRALLGLRGGESVSLCPCLCGGSLTLRGGSDLMPLINTAPRTLNNAGAVEVIGSAYILPLDTSLLAS